MDAPPVAITADSAWFAEYMKHTDSTEIRQLEQQLAATAGAGEKPAAVAGDGQLSAVSTSRQQTAGANRQQAVAEEEKLLPSTPRGTTSAATIHTKQRIAERPPVISAEDILRCGGVLDRPATARSAPDGGGANLRQRANSVPPRPARRSSPHQPEMSFSNGEHRTADCANGESPTPNRANVIGVVSSGGVALRRPAVYQDILRSLSARPDAHGSAESAGVPSSAPAATAHRHTSRVVAAARSRPASSHPRPSVAGPPPGRLLRKGAPPARDDVTQRYLAFIDELIQEKQDLAGRCEALVSQVAALEERHKQQLTALREKHRDEVQSSRRAVTETERTKRQKWMEKERERIKESTARGVQPQIEQLMRQHAEEQARLKQHYETVLTGGNSGMLDEVRGRMMREKDEAVATERREAAARYERQTGELTAQHSAEVARLTEEAKQLRSQLQAATAAADAQRDDAHREAERRARDARAEAEDAAQDVRRRLQHEAEEKTRELREKLREETDAALKRQKEELETASNNRLQAEVQRLKDERDARLEEVIDRLEKEVRRAEQGEAERATAKLRKQDEKHALEVCALEQSEERYKARLLDARAKIAERDEQVMELRARLNRKDSEIAAMKQTAELMQQEQQQLGDVIEAEFQSQVADLRRAADKWQQRLEEAERRYQTELASAQQQLDACTRQRDTDLHTLHSQIKDALSSRDARIQELTTAHQQSQKRAAQLETLLDKMRQGGCRCGGGSARK